MRVNKFILSLLTVITAWSGKGMAADAAQSNFSVDEREQLKAAVRMLIDAGVMKAWKDGSIYKMNDVDLLNELRTDGTIKKGTGVATVVCMERSTK